ncbi:TonB-dependent receptor [Xanthomonas translucens]|uniref:TonB-dependent receptor n=1 Tax=Xanthomonas campestris pv. translucens TaxID=343 RepID=UPI00071E9173|nr:TonB-dependent receptor [Xanthomonas translucens]UPU49425.1 TonB-dependent receptor [Xanthomonas translucens pv. undulosa]WLA04892.1 TonB-dependent receptor [Xanthomonas translucens]
MRQQLKKFRSKAMFTFVGGVLVINPAFAQQVPPTQAQTQAQTRQQQSSADAKTLDTVSVTGIRNSLNQSMGIKRDNAGVVDAISAEDIGKFPDTNLAESLQRITGISIERRDGEGAQVTARGFGPQFNAVTLNGRVIPGADAFGAPGAVPIGGVDGGTRAFNFAQLASEAITGLEVYKTSRANAPSGGIGATINILTDRPFNHKGLVASAGAKAAYDDSQPFDNKLTPEVSGIFSYTNPDKTWGIGLSGSYQKRRGGSVQATENGWNIQRWTGTDPALRPDANVQNAPAIGQLYGMPNDLRYAFADFERERLNGQAVVQFAPTDSLTLTLDYTYSSNEIREDRGEQGIWLQRANSFTDLVFDTGQAVATPVYLRDVPNGAKDFGMEQQRNMQKYKLGSLGFNADWQATDRLRLTFDAHNSKTQSLPNDPVTGGSATYFSYAGTNNCTGGTQCGGQWAQELFFNNSLPIGARTWYPTAADSVAGTNGLRNQNFSPAEIGSQVLRIYYQSQVTEVKEGRVDGQFDFDNGRFQFGVDSAKTTMHRRISDTNSPLGDWSVANAGNEPGMIDLLQPVGITGMFNDFNASGTAPGAWRGNADQLALWGGSTYGATTRYNPQFSSDNQVQEKTRAAYMQLEFDGELGGMTTNTRIGVRYEKTDVVSTSQVSTPTALEWQANNDFLLLRSAELQPFSEKHSYSHVLPNLDFSINLTDTLKGRASFGQSIARAPYTNLIAGPNPGTPTGSILINPSTRASGAAENPSLDPLESNNLDLALEWYFADASYVSLTFWDKRVSNFIGTSVTRENLYGLTDPTSGPDAQTALAFLQSGACAAQVGAAGNDVAGACSANDTSLFSAMALLRNAAATGGLGAYNGSSAQTLALENAYDLVGAANDPLYQFDVSRPINQNKAKIHGWELGGQYFLGDTGLGVYANYTLVKGDVGFDNTVLDRDQFALLGLSDTANVMLMYEKYGWSARLAWNWRDQYLIAANQNGSSRNPYYVEPYQQLDLSVSYAITDNLSVGFEAINLTSEDVRWHGRSEKQVIKVIDQSPRYTLGVRYNF